MKIFIIIVCLLLAMFSGYLLHSAINILREEIIFTRYFLTHLPPNVVKCISCSIFFFIMAAFLLIVTT